MTLIEHLTSDAAIHDNNFNNNNNNNYYTKNDK